MQQSITTKYLSPTDIKGTRIKAISTSGKWVIVSWNYDLSIIENHWEACQALCKKLEWDGQFIIGYAADGYVFVPSSNEKFTVDSN